MTLSPGTRVGSYEITGALGVGGMGEVYRAKDMRLGRWAAIKTLPPEFAQDDDRRLRFEREAKTLALLNHPHIAQVYGLEELAGVNGGHATLALVMELVEGEDLAQRIAHGPVPLDEVWPLARQIAEGLEAAHEAGIVHRDLKPANIRVTPDGAVKVLDFGLAKPVEPVGAAALAIDAPTLTSPALTTRGVVLGTVSYMAPEQAKGRPVDRRADIWAFGCVLFELLTGSRPFGGEDVPEILGAILKTEPDWTRLPAATPAHVRTLLTRCLAKDKTQRLQHIGDARLELENSGRTTPPVTSINSSSSVPRWLLVGVGAVALLLGALGGRIWSPQSEPVPARSLRFLIPAPMDVSLLQHAVLSPDGSRIVFAGTLSSNVNVVKLWLRELDSLDTREIQGVPSSVSALAPPFWSPDGRFIVFWDAQDRKLKRVSASGGVPVVVCDAPNYAGGAWGADGSIVFGTRGSGVFRVAAGGGQPEALTKLGDEEAGHIMPTLLPGGAFLLYHVLSSGNERRPLYVASLNGTERTLLASDAAVADVGGASYVPPTAGGTTGYARYLRGFVLMAIPLDPRTFLPTGDERPLAENVPFFSASLNGVLAYRTGPVVQGFSNRLLKLDRQGRSLGQAGPAGNYADLDLSPDGTRAVVSQRNAERGAFDLWIVDLVRGVPTRFTFEPSDDRFGTWSADGTWLAYASGVGRAHSSLFKRAADGTGTREVLLEGGRDLFALDVSPDARSLLYRDNDETGRSDLFVLSLSDTGAARQPVPFARTPFNEQLGRFSLGSPGTPRWVTYVSDESGKPEVYVASYPEGAGKVQVSSGGGSRPRWHPDGKELLYVNSEGVAVAVRVSFGPPFAVVGETKLFEVNSTGWDVAPDGTFVTIAPIDGQTPTQATPVTIVTDWPRAFGL